MSRSRVADRRLMCWSMVSEPGNSRLMSSRRLPSLATTGLTEAVRTNAPVARVGLCQVSETVQGVPGAKPLPWPGGDQAGADQVIHLLQEHLSGVVGPAADRPLVVAGGGQQVETMSGGPGAGGAADSRLRVQRAGGGLRDVDAPPRVPGRA